MKKNSTNWSLAILSILWMNNIAWGETSEINLSTIPVVQPTVGSETTPIWHQPYFQGERELFGYQPRFIPSDVSFDLDNRPYLRVGKYANGHDLYSDDNISIGVIQTMDDSGNWIELNTFLPAIKAKYSNWNGLYSSGVSMDERVVFDSSGDAYMVVHTYRSNLGFNVLLYSKDKCRTWQVYPLSSTYFFTKWEVPDGHNDTDKPPVLLVWPYGYTGGPIYMIVPKKTSSGNLILPVVMVTTDSTAYPMPVQAGMGNSTVSKGDLIHVVYLRNTSITGYTGTPQYVVTYDRSTGSVSSPVLLGVSDNTEPDIHDGPAITIDSQGYLHAVLGAHHQNFKYTKSLVPNSSTSGWTSPITIGRPQNGGGWSYVSLLCDKNDTLHIVGRYAGYAYYFGLWYIRKTADGAWEDLGPLVMPFREYYSNWYHRLSMDRQGRLFLNYMYYGDQYDRGSEYTYEIDAYKTKWPWENPYLIDSELTSWGGIQGHDPCMIMSDDGGDSWRIALTSSLRVFFDDSFDNGLDGWSLLTSGNTNQIQAMSSYTYNSKTITPRTGNVFAVSEANYYGKKASRVIEPAQSGMVTGYINIVENVNIGMIMIYGSGHEFLVMANSIPGMVSYRIDSVETPTTISVTPMMWHEVKFVAGTSGIDGYWDGIRLFHDSTVIKISGIRFGSQWSSAPCGYDDFSFLPLSASSIPGDANKDGVVDVGDLGILAANYGTTTGATWSQGDFNGDGKVDVGDLGILAANYGANTSRVDFTTDYEKVFNTTDDIDRKADEITNLATNSSMCSSLGLSLIAGVMLLSIAPIKSYK
jgi:hypothetical protein